MKKLLIPFLVCAIQWQALAASTSVTVTGLVTDVTTATLNPTLLFVPKSTPLADGSYTILDVTRKTVATNGIFSITLVGGRYDVDFGSMSKIVKILVPSETNAIYSFNQCAALWSNLPSFQWTNTYERISSRVQKGANVTFVTNNAQLASESITISTTGGTATNVILSEAGSGVVIYSNNLVYTIVVTNAARANLVDDLLLSGTNLIDGTVVRGKLVAGILLSGTNLYDASISTQKMDATAYAAFIGGGTGESTVEAWLFTNGVSTLQWGKIFAQTNQGNVIGTNQDGSVIVGGLGNTIPSYAATYIPNGGAGRNFIGNGIGNTISSSDESFIGGGRANTMSSGSYLWIGGGLSNTSAGVCTVLTGGRDNYISGYYSSVLGGYGNSLNGDWLDCVGSYNSVPAESGTVAFLIGYTNQTEAANAHALGVTLTNLVANSLMIGMGNATAWRFVDNANAPVLGSGGGLSNLNASALASGVVAPWRLAPTNAIPTGYVLAFDEVGKTNKWVAQTGGGGGSQTPWTNNINGAGYFLTNVGGITVTGTMTLGDMSANKLTVTNFDVAFTNHNDVDAATLAEDDVLKWTGDVWTNSPMTGGLSVNDVTNAANTVAKYATNDLTFAIKTSVTITNLVTVTNTTDWLTVRSNTTFGDVGINNGWVTSLHVTDGFYNNVAVTNNASITNDLIVGGNAKAATFTGSGSGLTALPFAQITGQKSLILTNFQSGVSLTNLLIYVGADFTGICAIENTNPVTLFISKDLSMSLTWTTTNHTIALAGGSLTVGNTVSAADATYSTNLATFKQVRETATNGVSIAKLFATAGHNTNSLLIGWPNAVSYYTTWNNMSITNLTPTPVAGQVYNATLILSNAATTNIDVTIPAGWRKFSSGTVVASNTSTLIFSLLLNAGSSSNCIWVQQK